MASEATVVREGAADAYWLVTALMEPQLATAELDVVHVTSTPSDGPPPHRHSREDELFYIIDGRFELIFDDTHFLAEKGDALFLPRNSIHTYANVGASAGRMLAITKPGGFAKFVTTTGDICLDRTKVPQIGAAVLEKLAAGCAKAGIELLPAHQPKEPAPRQPKPRELWVLGGHVKLLLTGEQTNGQFSVSENTLDPGFFVPPHTHDVEDEFFYVLEGELEFDLGETTISAPAGTFVHVPKQTLHGFRNAGTQRAKMLDCHTPGGFEKFFLAAGTPCLDIKLGPPKERPDMERFVAICRAHGMRFPT
jgi:quercetin dioxygenase-like cupin family protein